MIFALVLRTRLLLLETKILTPVWCGLQTQHSIQGNSCATTTLVPMKILKPTFWHFTFGHMLSLSVCLGCLQISNFLHGLTGKLTLPKMPTMQGSEMFTAQEYLHGFFFLKI
jgi:hypothetical protein